MGVRALGAFHSTATLSTQRVSMACVGFGPCTVSIFPCPATATLAGQAIFFRTFLVLTLTLVYQPIMTSSEIDLPDRLTWNGTEFPKLRCIPQF
jgi:hypothetical protein